jgi:hypothetical protein
MNDTLFEPELFWKVFLVTLVLAVVGLAVSLAIYGTLAVRDVVGTFISASIVAYMAHLWIARGREQ